MQQETGLGERGGVSGAHLRSVLVSAAHTHRSTAAAESALTAAQTVHFPPKGTRKHHPGLDGEALPQSHQPSTLTFLSSFVFLAAAEIHRWASRSDVKPRGVETKTASAAGILLTAAETLLKSTPAAQGAACLKAGGLHQGWGHIPSPAGACCCAAAPLRRCTAADAGPAAEV